MPLETAFYELGLRLAIGLLLIVVFAVMLGVTTLPLFYVVLFGSRLVINLFQVTGMRIFNYLGLMFRNITRNLLRTSLTYVAIFVLVFVISGIWTMLNFIDSITEEKQNDLKAIITEKHQIPSQMPRKFEDDIKRIANGLPDGMRPKNGDDDIMTWAFVGGSLDPNNKTLKNTVFFFAMEPRKLLTMMDGLNELTETELNLLKAGVAEMERNPRACIIGEEKLELMEKQVGDRFKIDSFNYPGITFEYEIIGALPKGSRYAQSAVMTREYFYNAINEHERKIGKEEFSGKCLNLIWIRLPSKEAFEVMASRVHGEAYTDELTKGERRERFSPGIKMETASTAFGAFLDPYRDIFWGMRWIFSPMIIVIITLIIAIAVSIGVRERRTEMAVLKVLGFKPWQVLALVLVEALLVGIISGAISSTLVYGMVNWGGGLPIKVAFFPKFALTTSVLTWGPIIGAFASFVGSIVPAWNTHKIKAAEVFARVA